MKRAIVVGGSNGIGLAITKDLILKGYHVIIVDKSQPDVDLSGDSDTFTFHRMQLLDIDEAYFESLREDKDIDVLMITAGFGRVTELEHIDTAEIKNMYEVNTVAATKIIRIFYDRIKNEAPFYCGIMGSIAGLICSPMFSVYAASKAAICRFVESVNIELEMSGYGNRITNISPGSINGTRFNGGKNDITVNGELAGDIVESLFERKELYIPQYDVIYKNVLENYKNDPHEFGVSSYRYKKASGRICDKSRMCIGYLSGTFDLFHVGHLNILRRAKQQCDYLIVGVHPDGSHKGKDVFIPYEERKEIVSAIKYVDKVVDSCPEDSDAWDLWHYNKLFVGSDYKGTEKFIRYEEYFKDKDVEIVYFPYTQGTSSTIIRRKILKNK